MIFGALLAVALAVTMLVAGGLAFAFGLSTSDTVLVNGFGPLDGLWAPADYCFLGTVLAAPGAGLLAFALACVALATRHGRAVLPRRRWLWCSLALLFGAAGAGAGIAALASQRGAKLTRGDASTARTQVALCLLLLGQENDASAMTTRDFQRREQARDPVVRYQLTTFRTDSTTFHDDGRITVAGAITSALKTTSVGRRPLLAFVRAEQNPPKSVAFTASLVRGEGGTWLIDDVQFRDE